MEDEPTLARIVKDSLEAENFSVEIAQDGVSGLEKFFSLSPDILVTDIMMPGMSGLDMVRRIRMDNADTPVLFLTAKSSADDAVEGFQAGGNDYLRKPFGMKELIARMTALLGRSRAAHKAGEIVEIGDYSFDSARRILTYRPESSSCELPNRESEILRRLCEKRGSVVPTKEILLDLWGDDDFFCTRSFQVLVSRLRHKLAKDARIRIENVRGEGYRLQETQ